MEIHVGMGRNGSLLLLRSADKGVDRYHASAARAGFAAESLPVLSCVQEPYTSTVQAALVDSDRFSCLIFTSHQAVAAAGVVLASAGHLGLMARWRQLPIFAVGGRTADAVAAIFGVHAKGGSAGSAAALGAVILQAYGLGGESTASGHGELKRKPALFLCSRIARGDLTEVLTAGSIEVDQVVAYDTCGNPFAGDEVVAALSSAIQDSRSPSLRVWVVFFSPSGVSAVLPTLQHCEHTFGKCVYYAAIGRTTATALEDGGVTVHAVAQNPNAEALIASIIESSVD
eukprot:m.115729 g.115729  ORF g.115729 m.115729 type:complete len:286 (-) comp21584_c0_seq4:4346-5203(-)